MYDPIRNQYAFRCPITGDVVHVSVSDFRLVKRLRGASSPAIFRVRHACPCGAEHESLITHESLDFEPLGTDSSAVFVDLMTRQRGLLSAELAAAAAQRIGSGAWPWTFYCYPEASKRPGFPSSVRMVAPGDGVAERSGGRVGVLVRCLHCERLTLNYVSRAHLDVPFHNDRSILYLDRTLHGEQMSDIEWFRHQLGHGPSAEARIA